MLHKIVVCLSFLNLVLLVQGLHQVQPGPPDYCLEGPFHKDVPSPEEEDFHECLSWQDHACCNLDLSVSISRHKARGLYNYSWDLCSTLSQRCEEFIKVMMHDDHTNLLCESSYGKVCSKPQLFFLHDWMCIYS